MPTWTREKLWIPYEIERGLAAHRLARCRRTCGSPSTTRATPPARSSRRRSSTRRSSRSTASASGRRAASASGRGNQIELQRQLNFPNSLGLLYSAFTYFCGFRVNSGEYKLMGLAPYGEPVYVDRIFDHLVDLRPDGSFRMEMKYFNYLSGPHDDEPALRRPVRRPAARAGVGDHDARARPRRVDPGRHRGDRAQHGARGGRRRPAPATPASPVVSR